MKKKLKALLEGKEAIGNAEVARLKKALETANLKFEKARTAKTEAKKAFKVAAEEWLCELDVPHTAPAKKNKKAPKKAQPKPVTVEKKAKPAAGH